MPAIKGKIQNKTKAKPTAPPSPNYGGARTGSGRRPTVDGGRTPIIASVLPETLALLQATATQTHTDARAAKASVFAATILDGWAEKDGNILGYVKYSKDLPGAYVVRRLQLSCYVSKSCALMIYERSLFTESSRSAIAGLILDVWAARQAALLCKAAE